MCQKKLKRKMTNERKNQITTKNETRLKCSKFNTCQALPDLPIKGAINIYLTHLAFNWFISPFDFELEIKPSKISKTLVLSVPFLRAMP